MKTQRTVLFALVICLLVTSAVAQVPQLLNYQGRVVVGTTNFDGTGSFKFALVNSNGTVSFWSNDGTSAGGSTPTASVSLPVVRGLYSVLLGDTTIAGMPTAIPATVFTNFDVRLRVWFNDGVTGVQQFTPDQRLAAVGYALMGANVPDGAITSNKLANGAVTGVKIADGSITTAKLAPNTVASSNLADSITLGETNVNGRLDVYRTSANTPAISLVGSSSTISTYGADGLEQIRLWGPSYGEILLNNGLSNNATAVRLTAQSSIGGQLELRNTNGVNRALLEGENSGGLLTLYQADGNIGAILYGNEGAGAGALSLRNTNGSARVRLFGQSPDSGGGEIAVNDDNGSEVIELKGNSSGGQVTIKDDTGVRNTAFLGSGVGGYQYLYNQYGNISVYLDGDSGGAGYISIRNTNSSSRVILDGLGNDSGGQALFYAADGSLGVNIKGDEAGSGELSVHGPTGTDNINLSGGSAGGVLTVKDDAGASAVYLAASGAGGGFQYLYKANGNIGVQLDGDNTGAGYIGVYGTNGSILIALDGQSSGDGRISCDVLQINGGSDLSEKFDITSIHDAIKPGMIVSIDPDKPGDLAVTHKAYDRTVAGIISGAGGVKSGMLMGQAGTKADGKHPVALTGRVYCYVDADAAGPIEPGDMITTSSTPGHGMKVVDHTKASGAIIGKAMSKLSSGKGLVLVLVSLQ
jgi:hypothetical protein